MLALAKCAYDACQLPDNNNRFILQGVYILIGIFVLLSDSKNFTYFQTMLFIFPILIDIVCSGPTNRLAWVVRWVIGVADTLIMIVCFFRTWWDNCSRRCKLFYYRINVVIWRIQN